MGFGGVGLLFFEGFFLAFGVDILDLLDSRSLLNNVGFVCLKDLICLLLP